MDPEKFIFPEWDSSNDYSYPDLVSFEDENSAEAITDKITLYADGKLIWGVEPDGTKPSDDPNGQDKPEPETVSKIKYGDVNCDGVVTLADSVALRRYASNKKKYPLTAQGKANADCVDAGKGITEADAVAIEAVAAGFIGEADLPMTAAALKKITS